MNHSTYIFGDFGRGYCQRPDDYTSDMFQGFCRLSTDLAQMIVHRDGNLMYYGYVLNFDGYGKQRIGFCIVLNGVYLTSIMPLMSSFEKAVRSLVPEGRVLKLRDGGNIEPATTDLLGNRQETDRAMTMISRELDGMEELTKVLPPTSYTVSKDEVKQYNADNHKEADIVDASCKYGYVVIRKATPTFVVAETEAKRLVADKQEQCPYEELKVAYRRRHGITSTKTTAIPSPVEGRYASLFAELKAKCSPDNFMNDYNHDKVDAAISFYQQVLASKGKRAKQKELRRRAAEQLGVTFSTRQLYDELCTMCNPSKFITDDGFDAQKAAVANDLYADMKAFADDIEILEAIKEEAIRQGLNDNSQDANPGNGPDDAPGELGNESFLTYAAVIFVIIIIFAIMLGVMMNA